MPVRWALFLSGRGSTAQAVMECAAHLDIRLVVSSKKSAAGLVRARRQGIPTLTLPKEIDWDDVDRQLRLRKINQIFLLGFMKMIPSEFVEKWQGRILNVHPSLLPAYPGLHAMEKSFSDPVDMGVTVHLVTAEMDAGPKLMQKVVLSHADKVKIAGNDFSVAQNRMSLAEQNLVRRAAQMQIQGQIYSQTQTQARNAVADRGGHR